MDIATRAKQYLKQCLSQGPKHIADKWAGLNNAPHKDLSHAEMIERNCALMLVNAALIATFQTEGTLAYESVAAQIDKRIAVVTEGWHPAGERARIKREGEGLSGSEKTALHMIRHFATRSDLLDALTAMHEMGFSTQNTREGNDPKNTDIILDGQAYREMLLIIQGRAKEVAEYAGPRR
ncbi:MAG: hypothetical protein K2Q01_04780 [Rickettsiales bacterium]|nr:hypothetical protein [Rickettsiales bacterium]